MVVQDEVARPHRLEVVSRLVVAHAVPDPDELAERIWPRVRGIVLTDAGTSAAAELGRRGGMRGGKARAKKLSPEKRSEIARKAAKARWGKKDTRGMAEQRSCWTTGALMSSESSDPDAIQRWRDEIDAMFQRMQTREWNEAALQAFEAPVAVPVPAHLRGDQSDQGVSAE